MICKTGIFQRVRQSRLDAQRPATELKADTFRYVFFSLREAVTRKP